MGRCFYYYFVGKIVGNVKKKNWFGNQLFFCFYLWNLIIVCVVMYFKGKIKIKFMIE